MPIVIDFVTVISFFFFAMSAASVYRLHNKLRYNYTIRYNTIKEFNV